MYIAIAPGFVYWPLSSTPGQSGGVITRSIDARLAVAALKAAIRPSALFTRPVPDMDVFLDRSDLCRDSCILASKNGEAQARHRRNAIILLVSNDLEQLCRAIAALRRDDAELGHMPTDRIRQHLWPSAPSLQLQ